MTFRSWTVLAIALMIIGSRAPLLPFAQVLVITLGVGAGFTGFAAWAKMPPSGQKPEDRS